MSVEERAVEMAGNWMKLTDFGWHGKPDEVDDKWALYYYMNRDSDSIARANAVAFEELANKYPDDISLERHGHFAVGHVDGMAIRVFNPDGSISAAFQELSDMLDALEDYPVFDTEKLSEVESEDEAQAWDSYARSDFAKAIENSFELSEDDEGLLPFAADKLWHEAAQHLNWDVEHHSEGPHFNINGAIKWLVENSDTFYEILGSAVSDPEYIAMMKRSEDQKMDRWHKSTRGYNPNQMSPAYRVFGYGKPGRIHAGMTVKISGTNKKGRVVMPSSMPGHWVINMGGRHGTPKVVHEDNLITR